MRIDEARRRWLLWAFGCAITGLLAAFSEILFLGSSSPRASTIAAVVGSLTGGIVFQLIRDGSPGFGGLMALTFGSLMGAKSGSVITALRAGLFFGILDGVITRLIERWLNRSRKPEPRPGWSDLADPEIDGIP